jgi:hypothetical protein
MKTKKKRSVHSAWGHHDTMIVNLRDWVAREINVLRSDLGKEVPHLEDDPSILKLLKSADDMNGQLFDLIRGVVDRAEVEAAKLKKTQPASVEETEVDEDFEDLR